jgi:hypothetical protein
MKLFTFLLVIVICLNEHDPFEKFTKEIPAGWSYAIYKDTLKIIRNDSIKTVYCGPSQSWPEDTIKQRYEIKIERTSLLSRKEIYKRKIWLDSILHVLKRHYKNKPDKSNASLLMSFQFRRNRIDSLRLPFYSDKNFSYFNYTNFPWGHCYINSIEGEEIDKVDKKYKIKK